MIPILTGVGGLAGYEKSAGAISRDVLLTPVVTSDRAGLALFGRF